MFFDKRFTGAVLVITALTHVVFTVSKMSNNITILDMVLNLLVLIVFIWATYNSLRIYEETAELMKTGAGKRAGDFKHVGNISNIYMKK